MSTVTTAWECCPGDTNCTLLITPAERTKFENLLPDFLNNSQRHFVLHLIVKHLEFTKDTNRPKFASLERGELNNLKTTLRKAKDALSTTGNKLSRVSRHIYRKDGSYGVLEKPILDHAPNLIQHIQFYINGIDDLLKVRGKYSYADLWIKGKNEKTTVDSGLDTILAYLVALMNFVTKQRKLDLIAELFDASLKGQSLTKEALKQRYLRMEPEKVKGINDRFNTRIVPLLSNPPK